MNKYPDCDGNYGVVTNAKTNEKEAEKYKGYLIAACVIIGMLLIGIMSHGGASVCDGPREIWMQCD